jgi:pimeloyl-ACP methyl ester carboxylesterase
MLQGNAMALIQHTRTRPASASSAPPIVFVHGFGCARSDWDEQVAHFSPTQETVAVDLGGHGTSPGGPEHARIETHGADVAALIETLDLPPAVLVGHSMGCRVVVDAASRVPSRVKALILVDGSRLGQPGSTAHIQTQKTVDDMGYRTFIEPMFVQMFSDAYDKAKARAIIERAMARPPEIAGRLFPDIGRYDSERYDATLAQIRVPVLAIQSTMTTPDRRRVSIASGQTTPYLDMLRAAIPGVHTDIIPDIGHFPQLERPAETNASMARFLADIR